MEYPKQILSNEFKKLKRALEKAVKSAGKGEITLERYELYLTNLTPKLKQLIEVISLIMTDEEINKYLFPVAEFSKFEKEVESMLEILEL